MNRELAIFAFAMTPTSHGDLNLAPAHRAVPKAAGPFRFWGFARRTLGL